MQNCSFTIFNLLQSMREIHYSTIIREYDNMEELPDLDQQLIHAALDASHRAYAPYSHFYVGAAVLLDDGTIVLGNNQENAAYPSGLCAERTALFAAGANYPGKRVMKLAIVGRSNDFSVDSPVYPCGACRQVMSEFEQIGKQPMEIFMMGAKGAVHVVNGLINILPLAFDADKLKRK
jgi:cytidine deaminase